MMQEIILSIVACTWAFTSVHWIQLELMDVMEWIDAWTHRRLRKSLEEFAMEMKALKAYQEGTQAGRGT